MAEKSGTELTPESVFPPHFEEPIPEDLALLNTLADLGETDSNVKVNVYRVDLSKGSKGGAFLFSCDPVEFNFEKLRDDYGGGTYRVHVRANGGIAANRLVTIEEPRRPKIEAQAQPSQDLVAPLTTMMQAMVAGFENLGKLIVTAQPQQQSRSDMLQEMLLYKQLFEQPQQSNVNPLDFVKQGIDLAKELGTSGKETGTADIVMGLLETFGKPIAEAVATAQATQRANPPPVPHPGAPMITHAANPAVIAPVHDNPAIASEQIEGDIMKQMQSYLNFLIAQAQADNDVYTYAGMILDAAPPEQIDQFINRPDWLDYLAQFEPNVKNFEPWFTQLRDAMKELLTPEPGSDTNGGNNFSGSSDALGNGNNGKP